MPHLGFLSWLLLLLPSLTNAVPAQLKGGDGDLNFLVLGDWGGLPVSPYRTSIEKSVAAAMNTMAGERGTEFQLALGDNFYFSGVSDVHDKRFQETFEDVFTGENLQNDWYFVAGNHDWNGNVSAEIAYTNVSKRWNYPSYYYSKTFKAPSGAVVEVVMIDTIVLCGQMKSDFSTDNSLYKMVDSKTSDDHWLWIQNQLANSRADYLLVAGHFPVYSIAEHGPTQCLIDRLRPMLFKYNVTAYLCGHDHNSQHLSEVQGSQRMDYFVIGSANFAQDSQAHKAAVPDSSSKFYNADPVGAFLITSVTQSEMSLTFVSGTNKELYQVIRKPRTP